MTPSPVIKNGALSGMAITWGTALVVVALTLLSASFRAHFDAQLSPELFWYFAASVVVMAAHKVESYFGGEFDQCPVYLTLGHEAWGGNPRKALFMGFVPTFVFMTMVSLLAMYGPPWPLVLAAVWLAQGLHELHHVAKSLVRRRLYPGTVTAVLFVGVVAVGFYPRWFLQVVGEGPSIYLYWMVMPLVFAAFYVEDRWWTGKVPEALWRGRYA